MHRPLAGSVLPLGLRQVECVRIEWPIAAGLGDHRTGAVRVIIGDRFPTGFECAVAVAVANHDIIVAEMVEQGRQPLLEQGQPMLHASHPPSVGQCLLERVAGRRGAEQLAVA